MDTSLQQVMDLTMTVKQYILREILSETELENFLRLRYDGFCTSASNLFVTRNSNAIDVNYYDRNSKHYGVYTKKDKKSEPVGYFRIVLEEPTIADEWVSNISRRYGLTYLTEHKPQSAFPCLGIYPHSGLEQEFYKRKLVSEKAGEVSRFLIIQSERSLRLSLYIIRSAFAIALLHIQHALVGCFHDHSKVYMNFGFRQCPGSSTFSFDSAPRQKEGMILYCKTQYLTNELKTKCKEIQEQFLSNRCLTFSW
jgi:hypothetical protein